MISRLNKKARKWAKNGSLEPLTQQAIFQSYLDGHSYRINSHENNWHPSPRRRYRGRTSSFDAFMKALHDGQSEGLEVSQILARFNRHGF